MRIQVGIIYATVYIDGIHSSLYVEALLWLYRSHADHKRVLSALSEANCCGESAWTRKQYYAWVTEYLIELWNHNKDGMIEADMIANTTYIHLVWPILKTVFEYDVYMGLNILLSNKVKPAEPPAQIGVNNISIAPTLGYTKVTVTEVKCRNRFYVIRNVLFIFW